MRPIRILGLSLIAASMVIVGIALFPPHSVRYLSLAFISTFAGFILATAKWGIFSDHHELPR